MLYWSAPNIGPFTCYYGKAMLLSWVAAVQIQIVVFSHMSIIILMISLINTISLSLLICLSMSISNRLGLTRFTRNKIVFLGRISYIHHVPSKPSVYLNQPRNNAFFDDQASKVRVHFHVRLQFTEFMLLALIAYFI